MKYFFWRTIPVLAREREQRERIEAQLACSSNHRFHGVGTPLVPDLARQTPSVRPATVSVHDDPHVARKVSVTHGCLGHRACGIPRCAGAGKASPMHERSCATQTPKRAGPTDKRATPGLARGLAPGQGVAKLALPRASPPGINCCDVGWLSCLRARAQHDQRRKPGILSRSCGISSREDRGRNVDARAR